MKLVSANFEFLAAYKPQLPRIGGLAERYFKDDPNTCLIKLRQFGEVLAQLTAAKSGLFTSSDEQQADLLRRLKFERVLPNEVADLFHQIRISGDLPRFSQPVITGDSRLLTRPGKLSRRKLEISACVVRFVPDLPADLQ